MRRLMVLASGKVMQDSKISTPHTRLSLTVRLLLLLRIALASKP